MEKRKRPARLLAAFFAALVVLTFFSRAIYASMLPQVRAVRVSVGVVETEFEAETFSIRADGEETLCLPEGASGYAISVSRLCVREGEYFSAGDARLSLNAREGARVLAAAQREESLALRDLEEWRYARQEDETARRASIEEEYRFGDSETARQLEARLAHDKAVGLYAGRYEDDLVYEYEQAKTKAAALQALADAGWAVCAEEDGVLLAWETSAGGASGERSLCRYAPEGSNITLAIRSQLDWREKPAQMRVTESLNDRPWSYQGRETDENGMLWFLTAPEAGGLFDVTQVRPLTIHATSAYTQAIIPEEAVEGGAVWVLRTRTGSWGVEETYVERVRVQILAAGDGMVSVSGKLSPGDRVVTLASRTLADSDRVYVRF